MDTFLQFPAFVVMACSAWHVCCAADLADVPAAEIDALFAEWDHTDRPGLAVGIFVDGRAIHRTGYGMANLDDGMVIKPDSIFGTYSMAKSFTSACIASLLDEGRISLDDDIRRYVTELPNYAETLRIRHLIRCRSGLQDYVHAMILSGREIDDAWSKADVLDMICRQKTLPFAADENFSYSNSDYFLLGLIVERVSGQSLRAFARERIFEPLGMHNTAFDDDRSIPLRNRAHGYGRRTDGSYHRIGMNSSTVGAVGLKTTIDDLLQWDRNFRNNELGKGAHLQEFFATGSLINNDNCLCGYGNSGYRGVKRLCQTGGGPGFIAHYVRFPDLGLSVALLSNLSEADQWHAMQQKVGEIAQLYLADHLAEPDESFTWDANPDIVQLTPEQLQAATGGFRKPDGSFVRLVVHDGGLAVEMFNTAYPPPVPIRLTPVSQNRFRASGHYVPYDIVFDSDTSPPKQDSITVRYQDGYRQKWKRVELVSPDADELKAYAGEYECRNLGAVYRFSVHDGQLFVQFNFGRKRKLVPATADIFVPETGRWDDMRFEFARDDAGHVRTFGLTFQRVHFEFERR